MRPFEIDETDYYCVTITSKKRGDGYHSFLKLNVSFDVRGDMYTNFLVMSYQKKDVDTRGFHKLTEAIEFYNSIR